LAWRDREDEGESDGGERNETGPSVEGGSCDEELDLPENKFQLDCLRSVLLKKGIPMTKAGKLVAHHGEARSGLWNGGIRLKSMHKWLQAAEQSECSIWEVGASISGADSRRLMPKYPKCEFHLFEPVPSYVSKLAQAWKDVPRAHVHAYGLALRSGSVQVPARALAHESTYLGDFVNQKASSDKEQTIISMQMKSFREAMADAGGPPSVMHVNCEGCEWDLFPDAHNSGVLARIPVIQWSAHTYGSVGVGSRVWELCKIRGILAKTHTMVDGVPFGWERWVRQDLQAAS
jgi:FkbM family methyltransferase